MTIQTGATPCNYCTTVCKWITLNPKPAPSQDCQSAFCRITNIRQPASLAKQAAGSQKEHCSTPKKNGSSIQPVRKGQFGHSGYESWECLPGAIRSPRIHLQVHPIRTLSMLFQHTDTPPESGIPAISLPLKIVPFFAFPRSVVKH